MASSNLANIDGVTTAAGPFFFLPRPELGTLTWDNGQSKDPCLVSHFRLLKDLAGAAVYSWRKKSISTACGGKPRPRCCSELCNSRKVATALFTVTGSAWATCFWANRKQDFSHEAKISLDTMPVGRNAPALIQT